MNIQDYPAEIERASLELNQTQAQIDQYRDSIKVRELAAYGEVITARDNEGKLQYTNERAREIAAAQVLARDKTHQANRKRELEAEAKRAIKQARLERLRREFQVAMIDYEREQLGKRAA